MAGEEDAAAGRPRALLLPFEAEWFRKHGCNATLVGHPYFDEIPRRPLDAEFVARCRRSPGRC